MSRHNPRLFALALVASLAGALALAPPARAAKANHAVSAAMLEQLEAELDRAMKSLTVPGEPKPYHIAYKLTEVEVNDVTATLGVIGTTRDRHFMNLDASVRVGDYEFDNSNFLIPRQEGTDGLASIQLPLEATPKIARKSAWLATDAAFKEALEQYTAKKSADQRRASRASGDASSYSREPPLVKMDPLDTPPLESPERLAELAQDVSAVFRDHANVRESRVAFTSFLERRWYLNTEGTRAHDTRRVSGVVIVATTRTEDGEIIPLYFSRYGRTLADLPSPADLKREARRIADTLDQLRTAAVLGSYTGPVLFQGSGAVGMIRNTLAYELSGTPVPDGLSDSEFGGAFSDRIGLRVVSPLLSVSDDPTANRAGKQALIGGFLFDDEGVRAQKVDIIADGELETLLMSRTPSPKIPHSNGHARRQGPGMYHGSTTNLFVTGKGGLARPQLIKKLVAEAKGQGLDYGLLIQLWDDPMITASGELSPLELVSELQGRQGDEVPAALLAYKVYANGREELVRGVQVVGPVPTRAWRDVVAVGKDPTVENFLATTDDGVLQRFQGGGPGLVPSAGVESAVVTPDLLFRELDVRRNPASLLPPPAVPKPAVPKAPAKGAT